MTRQVATILTDGGEIITVPVEVGALRTEPRSTSPQPADGEEREPDPEKHDNPMDVDQDDEEEKDSTSSAEESIESIDFEVETMRGLAKLRARQELEVLYCTESMKRISQTAPRGKESYPSSENVCDIRTRLSCDLKLRNSKERGSAKNL